MRAFFIAATLAVFGSQALAAPLNPGTVVMPAGTDFTDPVHGGVQLVVNDNLIGFSLDPTPGSALTAVSGQIQNRVTQLGSGNLRFAPRIRNTMNLSGGIFAITTLQLEGFGAFDIDADFRTDGLGDKGPTSYSRSVDGNIITARFTDPMAFPTEGGLVIESLAGGLQEESLFPSFVTDATAFDLSGSATISGYLIDEDLFNAGGGIFQDGTFLSVTVDGLAVPVAPPVPLPASFLFLGAGIAALRLLPARKRAA